MLYRNQQKCRCSPELRTTSKGILAALAPWVYPVGIHESQRRISAICNSFCSEAHFPPCRALVKTTQRCGGTNTRSDSSQLQEKGLGPWTLPPSDYRLAGSGHWASPEFSGAKGMTQWLLHAHLKANVSRLHFGWKPWAQVVIWLCGWYKQSWLYVLKEKKTPAAKGCNLFTTKRKKKKKLNQRALKSLWWGVGSSFRKPVNLCYKSVGRKADRWRRNKENYGN